MTMQSIKLNSDLLTRLSESILLALIILLMINSITCAQQTEETTDQKTANQKSTEIFRFIRDQIPELEEPLRSLRRNNPQQFNQAMQSLNQSYTRLQQLKESGNETGYKRALESWTFNATIQMLTAQLSIEETGSLKRQLQRILRRQYDAKLRYFENERDRMTERLKELNLSIENLENSRDDTLNRRFESILRASERSRRLRERESKQNSRG